MSLLEQAHGHAPGRLRDGRAVAARAARLGPVPGDGNAEAGEAGAVRGEHGHGQLAAAGGERHRAVAVLTGQHDRPRGRRRRLRGPHRRRTGRAGRGRVLAGRDVGQHRDRRDNAHEQDSSTLALRARPRRSPRGSSSLRFTAASPSAVASKALFATRASP